MSPDNLPTLSSWDMDYPRRQTFVTASAWQRTYW